MECYIRANFEALLEISYRCDPDASTIRFSKLHEVKASDSIPQDYLRAREKMVDEQIVARGITSPRLLAAMRQIPRHLFVDPGLLQRAYDDSSLPIGQKQTLSQPYMAARMTEALELTGEERVLEIGTGSGYQTALLAELSFNVFSVEKIRALAAKARGLLDRLHYHNVAIQVGDGTIGWPEHAPFDAVMVTAGAPDPRRSSRYRYTTLFGGSHRHVPSKSRFGSGHAIPIWV